jgi:hypothetical protein
MLQKLLTLLLVLAVPVAGTAAVLPEERMDALYHFYSGDNVEIDGPSLLVRKNVGESISLSASYYVDTVSSASVDVVTTASPYSEERKQWGTGVDYLHGDTTLSVGFSNSEENDYTADTLNFGISQEVFGGLTTISIGYGSGDDEVRRRGTTGGSVSFDPVGSVEKKSYRLGLSQVLTRNWLMGFSFETMADEGFLNNPYRSVRYVDGSSVAFQPERYPRTRASNAAALRSRYYLPWRAAFGAEYRFFTDDWGIDAHTIELGYTHPLERLTFDFRYRVYTQSSADFYSDLFPFRDAQNFLARDKELASFQSHGPHVGMTYQLFDRTTDERQLKGTVSVFYDYLLFNYDDFRDTRVTGVDPGTEPFFSFEASVVQAFFSIWF